VGRLGSVGGMLRGLLGVVLVSVEEVVVMGRDRD
jgi:hypothetical protein